MKNTTSPVQMCRNKARARLNTLQVAVQRWQCTELAVSEFLMGKISGKLVAAGKIARSAGKLVKVCAPISSMQRLKGGGRMQ